METLRPPLPDKDFFSMGEACRIAQVPGYTLRYWEASRLLRPIRRESGHRRYTRRDIETILRIKGLLQGRKLTLAGARKALLARASAEREQGAVQAAQLNTQALKVLRDVRDEIRGIVTELSR